MRTKRMLMVARGGGSFDVSPPTPPSSFELVAGTVARHAGWTEVQDPKAYQDSGYVIATWVNMTTGHNELQVFDDATGAPVSAIIDVAAGTADIHANGSVIVDSVTGKLVVAYCDHDAHHVYVRRSVSAFAADPDLSSGLDSERVLLGSGDYTYCILVQLRGVVNDPIYLFYRDFASSTGRLAYIVSTDGGDTWGSPTLVFTGAVGKVPYWRIGSDWDTRIDIITTDEPPNDSASLGHFSMIGSSRFTSDGTPIAASLPITFSDITLIADDSGGSIEGFGVSYTAAADPVTVYQVDTGSDNDAYQARWTGASWDSVFIAAADGILAGNQFASGMAVHHEDPDIVLLERRNSGTGKFDLWRYVSGDDGATWAGTQYADGSADLMWFEVPHFAALTQGVGQRGTYVSDTNLDAALYLLVPA